MIKDVAVFFDGYKDFLDKFKKNTYGEMFEKYLSKVKVQLDEMLSEESSLTDTSGLFSSYAKQELLEQETKSKQSKIDKEKTQMELNLFMVSYVFPAILTGEKKKAEDLCDEICTIWAAEFKDSKIKYASYETVAGGFHSKMCYITTAVCKSLKLGDDCMQLKLLRDYRDNILSLDEDGKSLISEYYDIAPTIVSRINQRPDADEIYMNLWNKYISKCVEYLEENNYQSCKTIYQDMVITLKKEYWEVSYE